MDTELIDGAACPASDVGARLLAELSRAKALLAVADARAFAALAKGEPIPTEVRSERILHRRQLAVMRQMLDGMPIEGDRHAASA